MHIDHLTSMLKWLEKIHQLIDLTVITLGKGSLTTTHQNMYGHVCIFYWCHINLLQI